MSTSRRERRKAARRQAGNPLPVTIAVYENGKKLRELNCELADCSASGMLVDTSEPLNIGSLVSVTTPKLGPDQMAKLRRSAYVVHCRPSPNGHFHVGLVFQEAAHDGSQTTDGDPTQQNGAPDLYEVLQVSPTADFETIRRVYRVMAQRYHPDNQETGDEEAFKAVLHAYRVLSDPSRRSAYHAAHRPQSRLRRKVVDQRQAALAIEAEKSKRWGVLSLLYSKKMMGPGQPGMTIRQLEDLLDCPREKLEFSLWYLTESGLITRTDNARLAITVKGVDTAEGGSGAGDQTRQQLLGPSESTEESYAESYAPSTP